MKSQYHHYTIDEIKKLCQYFKEINCEHNWKYIYENHMGDFIGTDGNKICQFANRKGLANCKTKEQVDNWLKNYIHQQNLKPSQKLEFKDLESIGMSGGNELDFPNENSTNDFEFNIQPLQPNNIISPPLMKDIKTNSGLLLAPYTAETDSEILIGWKTSQLDGVKLEFSFKSDTELLIIAHQKPIENKICRQLTASLSIKIDEDDFQKMFAIPTITTTAIKLPCAVDDQNIKTIATSTVIGIVMRKKIFNKSYFIDVDSILDNKFEHTIPTLKECFDLKINFFFIFQFFKSCTQHS